MSVLSWIVNDLSSIVPSYGYSENVQAAPAIGAQAPASSLLLPDGNGIIILFTRHMGCPFCEQEIRSLISTARKPQYKELQFLVVTHSVSSHELDEFVVNELGQTVPDNVTLFGDAERRVYPAWGLGELGWGGLVPKNVLKQMGELRKEGISNRLTRGTRWQTNGGFAIDKSGKVRFSHVGMHSGDTTDIQAAIRSLS